MQSDSSLSARSSFALYIAIGIITLAVFATDSFARLGIAVWVFYLVPMVLCVLQPRAAAPYLLALCQSMLMVLAYFLSPEGLIKELAAINRSLGVVVLFSVAYLVDRIITERRRMQSMLWMERGETEVGRSMVGEQELEAMGDSVLRSLAGYLDAKVALLYRLENGMLVPTGSFAAAR